MLYSLDLKYISNSHHNYANVTTHVLGVIASGIDLVLVTTQHLYHDKAITASQYRLHTDILPETKQQLRSQNQRALAIIEAWMSEPDDLGTEWWDEFEQEIQHNRLTFREL